MELQIRKTTQQDREAIFQLENLAFPEDTEVAVLADDLLATEKDALSLLALVEDQPVGHILFTNCHIEGRESQPSATILAPLAVLPAYQKMGIGGELVKEGLRRLKAQQVEIVFVLGHIEYYPRHGFLPALGLGYYPPYPTKKGLEDAWMLQTLNEAIDLENYTGRVVPAKAMDRPNYW
ncbi:N-acetyltransferase [Enterococcus florum]|uniref:N-acetyltransferase n=1 Tax=Enterococcus florum TaxID=2480627 RepID=A0A4P5P8J5_9ENTE|nr:N-acetyltransferase [Enterococcus florum]GCF94170.1 N-acetyltransferase [Enterococcus florum]